MVQRRPFRWISFSAVAIFILHASLFLCFFVDDEAIPLVYARNLLRGRGLVYTVLEGRVEGYSDFLHVLWSAVLLRVTTALGLSNLAPIAIGKVVSFIAGIAIVLLTARTMRRAGVSAPGLAAGLAFLALSGPLAIWACSSLETAVFALLVSGLASILFLDLPAAGDQASDAGSAEARLPLGAAILLGAAIVLERIDGFIYAGTLLAAALLTAGRFRRRDLLKLSAALAAVAFVYCAWRYMYFGALVSTPIEAKVLHRFAGAANQVVEEREVSYLRSFLDLYGVVAVAVLAAAIVLGWRARPGRPAVISLIVLGVYVAAVDDWMFGWRLTVALLPLTALIISLAVTRIPGRFAWVAAALILAWSGVATRAFLTSYRHANRWPIFWTRPHSGAAAWLQPYGDLLTASHGLIKAGDRVAYNQAGIVPYALDVENVDDLGLCSRFVARLPTSDVVHTGVGRYSPLRNQPVLATAQAYLLYQDVRFLISRTHLLRGANRGVVPDQLLNGYFRHVLTDPSDENAVYQRTEKDASEYQRNPDLFTENLAHVSRLVRASIGAEVLKGTGLSTRFGFLREERTRLTFDTATEVNVQFAVHDEDVFSIFVDEISATVPTVMTVAVFNAEGREVGSRDVQLTSTPRPVLERFEPQTRARTLSIRFRASAGVVRINMKDMRLEGQSAALRDYVRETLQFRR